MARKIREDSFSLEDFAAQLKQLRSMGPLGQIMEMIPMFKGAKGMPKELKGEEQDLKRFEAIIGSMTPDERVKPAIINGSRRSRIAKGSGTQVADVNRPAQAVRAAQADDERPQAHGGRMGKLKGAVPFLPR
jgi:signal recognition particle subunit SRP54